MTPDEMEKAQAFAAYADARRALTLRERIGISVDGITAEFGEPDLALLADRLREAWGRAPPAAAEGPPDDAEDGRAWSRIGAADDVEALIRWVDDYERKQASELAEKVVRKLFSGGTKP
jgi:hypothetical protein